MNTLQEKFSDNVYIVDYPFDIDILHEEYLRAEKHFKPYSDHRGSADWWKIAKWDFKYANELMDFFEIKGSPRFYFLGKNQHLPKHKDNGTECALNVVLNKNIKSAVTYDNANYYYRSALLNTQKEHEVFNGPEDRMLFKISIFDETFEQVRDKIESVLEKHNHTQ